MIAMIAEHTALCAPIEIQPSERVDTVMSFHAPPPEAKTKTTENERKKRKMKRIVCALLAVILMIGMVPMKASAVFDGDAYYQKAVTWAKNKGIVSETFSATSTVKRGEMVTYMWKAAGSPKLPRYIDLALEKFHDVHNTGDGTLAYAVGWAVSNNVTAGRGNGVFAPNDTMTNKEAITFLWAAATKKGALRAYETHAMKIDNLNSKDEYYETPAKWANDNGYLSSVPSFGNANAFLPNQNTSSAVAIYLLWEMCTGKYHYGVAIEKMVQFAVSQRYNGYASYSQNADAWCADFATYCAQKYALTYNDNPVQKTSSCWTLMQHFCKNYNFYISSFSYNYIKNDSPDKGEDFPAIRGAIIFTATNFTPKRGDFVFFRNNVWRTVAHVGIVTEVKPLGNNQIKISTVEGNTGNCVDFKEYTYNVKTGKIDGGSGGFDYIVGFGRIR